jgi:V8-like Glu-specific endopeptidase
VIGIDSNILAPGEQLSIGFSSVVHIPNAAWLRLSFTGSTLPADGAAVLRITSALDGGQQRLNQSTLEQWGHSSAYFNGDTVLVEVLLRPESGEARIIIDRATAQLAPAYQPRSICGPDDRVPSTDPRSGRFLPAGCTAWLFNDANHTFLTAGHCGQINQSVVQFNVPLSTISGALVNPPPEDQYVVEPTSVQSREGDVGSDFAYFATYPNSNTGLTAYQRQGAAFTLAPVAPAGATGQQIRVTGYGIVSAPVDMTWNQAETTHAGAYVGLNGVTIRYLTDTTEGDSGAAAQNAADGTVIGIHTSAGCATGGNEGLAIQAPLLQIALQAPQGGCASGRGTPTGSLFIAGDIHNSLGTLDTATGHFAAAFRSVEPVSGLAYDGLRAAFLATTWGTGQGNGGPSLVAIDSSTGATQVLGRLSGLSADVSSLAFLHSTRTLYGMVQSSGQLCLISDSGIASPVGPAGGGEVSGIAADDAQGILHGLDNAGGATRLIRIQVQNGARTIVGALGVGISNCKGLALLGGDLFTIDRATSRLLRINRVSGTAAVIGPTAAILGGDFDLTTRLPAGCTADFNFDGGVGIEDLLLYLDAYDSETILADIDDGGGSGTLDGGVGIEDLLYYLSHYDAGC